MKIVSLASILASAEGGFYSHPTFDTASFNVQSCKDQCRYAYIRAPLLYHKDGPKQDPKWGELCTLNCERSCDWRITGLEHQVLSTNPWDKSITKGFRLDWCKLACNIYVESDWLQKEKCNNNCDAKCEFDEDHEKYAEFDDPKAWSWTGRWDAPTLPPTTRPTQAPTSPPTLSELETKRLALTTCDAELKASQKHVGQLVEQSLSVRAELQAAKECKAKSPNYKVPVNDPECNPKNCDEWDCGQWCKCYNADHDAFYELVGCAADDEDTCQC